MKKPKLMKSVDCGNPACDRRNLWIETYAKLGDIRPDTPPDHVHRVHYPEQPYNSVVCPQCGHYTIIDPRPPRD